MPSLTVAITAGANARKASELLGHLRRQTIAHKMEVIVVSFAEANPDFSGLAGGLELTVLHHPGSADFGHARAEAARRARAPYIAYLEDHTAPAPDWAEQVLLAFENAEPGVTAITYAFRNGSPDTYFYRSAFMAEYGALAWPLREGPSPSAAANNIAYRRDALLAAGPELDSLLEMDFFLQKAMGDSFLCHTAPRAVVYHQTNARLTELVWVHFLYARLFASRRVEHERWSLFKRIAAAPIVPLAVPLLRIRRLFRALRGRAPLPAQAWKALPLIVLLYCAGGLGEAAGLLRGAGVSGRSLVWMELEAERASR
jgi:hypothetical protein